MLHFCRNDPEAGLLETGQDLSDSVLANGIGLDDRKGALQRHSRLLLNSVKVLWTGVGKKHAEGITNRRRIAGLRVNPNKLSQAPFTPRRGRQTRPGV